MEVYEAEESVGDFRAVLRATRSPKVEIIVDCIIARWCLILGGMVSGLGRRNEKLFGMDNGMAAMYLGMVGFKKIFQGRQAACAERGRG